MDWFSRYVLAFRTVGSDSPCQGCQFTSVDFTEQLKKRDIKISMDGRGRAFDNIFVERLWRSVKYEDIYPKGYQTMAEAKEGLKHYFQFYNNERSHQSLGYRTPREVYMEKIGWERVSIHPR